MSDQASPTPRSSSSPALWWIGAALVVIAVVLIFMVVREITGGESDARKAAREEAEKEAEYYCALGGASQPITGSDDPAYLNCVDRQIEISMGQWDAANPDEALED